MKKYFFIILFVLSLLVFYKQFFFQNKIPISADTIVGLYHPFRDLYAKEYPNGIPYKNFLITDPVRQQYPWRYLAIHTLKDFELPLWNPYSFSGTPLLANIQSAVFYPINIVFFVLPFQHGWAILVIAQSFFAFLFLYLYLRQMQLKNEASFLGAFAFAFCGFSIAWLEWNTIVQTALWLPLIFLLYEHLLKKITYKWVFILIVAQCCQFFAGHLQVWFYAFFISNIYLLARIVQLSYDQKKKRKAVFILKKSYPFFLVGLSIAFFTAIQWIPTLQLLFESARSIDQTNYTKEGWFMPWHHLLQFISPDFYGNPTTLNYWGTWNYGELVGYIGIFPLIMALYACFFRRDNKTLFFLALLILSLALVLPTPFAFVPFILKIPFLSTAQPTRFLFVIDFSLSILAALGFDYFIRLKQKKIFTILILISILFIGIWMFVFIGNNVRAENLLIAKRNMIFPTLLLVGSIVFVLLYFFMRFQRVQKAILFGLLALTVIDLIRFGDKFTPFTNQAYLFPQTKIIDFLQKNIDNFRFMSLDSRILPPNFSTYYKLQTVEGYDPIYLRRYGELIVASERNMPDISPPFGFNRIITPHRYNSPIINLLGVKYILSMDTISTMKPVFVEGKTKVYQNKNVFPRAFFVKKVSLAGNKNQAIQMLFSIKDNLQSHAVVEQALPDEIPSGLSIGTVTIDFYSPNKIKLTTRNEHDGFLVLTDVYYSVWHATVDGFEKKMYITDYAFRGIVVPKGNHTVVFSAKLF